ncbi:hypothetical protein AB0E88_15360 [Streptomyces sp. NPDC028635]|uniref:hypothetical protein n=1 Tax=Streptomyces sp. NPDC028635 TaxID=3154800 RepID=UPI0033C47FC1
MVWVAVLLLPLLSVLLLIMDRMEDRLFTALPARHRHAARRRHLRLVRGGRASHSRKAAAGATSPEPAGPAERPAA